MVAGQIAFTLNMPNFTDSLGVLSPQAVALDTSVSPPHLYVADQNNNRVLGWLNAQTFANGAPADLVIGQPDFMTVVPPLSASARSCAAPNASNLCFPRGVAVDSNGNLYVADTSNNRVLEYNTPFTSGTTAARVFGQGGKFNASDCNRFQITASSLCAPVAVALDPSGNLYVADAGNNRVLEYNSPLTSNGTANLVFGQLGSFTTGQCNQGGIGAGSLCSPTGVVVDSTGNLYVADTGNSRVLGYTNPIVTGNTSASVVLGQSNFTGDLCNSGGNVSASGLCQPNDVAVDASQNVFVSDTANSRVLKFAAPLSNGEAAALVFGQAGSFTTSGCAVGAAKLCAATGLAFDSSGDLFVSDSGNSRVLEFKPPFSSQPAAAGELGQPDFVHAGPNRVDTLGYSAASGIALDQSVSPPRLYLADSGNNRVLAWASVAAAFSHLPANLVIGQPDAFSSSCAGTLCDPEAVAVDGTGNLYVADNANNRVLIYFSPFTTDILPDLSIPVINPTGVAVDGSGDLFVADVRQTQVQVFEPPLSSGMSPTLRIQGGCFVSPGPPAGTTRNSLCGPHGVAVDSAGRLYVADMGDNRVLEYDTPLVAGALPNRVFGQNGSFTSASCAAGSIGLCLPMAVSVDSGGHLFIADTGNSRVLEFNAPLLNSVATIVFGQGGNFTATSPNSGGLSAGSLWLMLAEHMAPAAYGGPYGFGGGGVANDNSGNLYVADNGNNRLLEFNGPFPTSTLSPTPTRTPTATPTATVTATKTPTPKPTNTPARTPTRVPTQTATQTATQTPKPTPIFTQTATGTATPSRTPTPTRTPTGTPTATGTPTPTPTVTPTPGPYISSIPATINAGDSFTISGLRFTGGSRINFFVATASGAVNFGPLVPSSFSPTALVVLVPSTITLGQGVVSVQVVNTDEGFAASNVLTAQLFGDPAFGFPNLNGINGVGLAATSTNPAYATDNVETVVPQGQSVTLNGFGFDTKNGVAVDLFCACTGGKVGPFFLNPGNPGLSTTAISFVVPASGDNAPVTGPGSFVVSNRGSAGTYSIKSNAVSVPIGQRISVVSVSQSGSTITVNGTGFSTLTVINLFNSQGGVAVNLGGLQPDGKPKIPLTLINSTTFTFTRPATAVPGPAYVQAFNPPFVPFSSSDSDPGGAFMIE